MTKELTIEEIEKKRAYAREYSRMYYKKHRELILDRNRIKYFNTKKKTPKCKKCGDLMPKWLPGQTKYCDKCLCEKGQGKEAHNLAAVRYYRKKHLTRKVKFSII